MPVSAPLRLPADPAAVSAAMLRAARAIAAEFDRLTPADALRFAALLAEWLEGGDG